MMGEDGNRGKEKRDTGDKNAELRFHGNTSLKLVTYYSLYSCTRARHVASCEADLIVFQTDELHQIEVWAHQLRCKFQMNRPRKGPGVIDGKFIDERAV